MTETRAKCKKINNQQTRIYSIYRSKKKKKKDLRVNKMQRLAKQVSFESEELEEHSRRDKVKN